MHDFSNYIATLCLKGKSEHKRDMGQEREKGKRRWVEEEEEEVDEEEEEKEVEDEEEEEGKRDLSLPRLPCPKTCCQLKDVSCLPSPT